MSMIEDVRQVIQDFLAPELRAIAARLDAADKVTDAQHKETIAQLSSIHQKVDSLHREAMLRSESMDQRLTARLDQILSNFALEKRLDRLEGRRESASTASVVAP